MQINRIENNNCCHKIHEKRTKKNKTTLSDDRFHRMFRNLSPTTFSSRKNNTKLVTMESVVGKVATLFEDLRISFVMRHELCINTSIWNFR